MASPNVAPSIVCDKCKQGTMVAQRVPRMGHGLNIVGFTLIIPSILLLLGSTACGVLMGGAGTSAASEGVRRSRTTASSQLLDIPEVPRADAEAFANTGTLSQATIDALPPAARVRAESVISIYNAGVAGTALGTTAVAGAAGFGVVASYVIGLPFLIVGLLLIRKKNVWQCPTCQYVFDRG